MAWGTLVVLGGPDSRLTVWDVSSGRTATVALPHGGGGPMGHIRKLHVLTAPHPDSTSSGASSSGEGFVISGPGAVVRARLAIHFSTGQFCVCEVCACMHIM